MNRREVLVAAAATTVGGTTVEASAIPDRCDEIDCALSCIRWYAEENNLDAEQVRDTFNAGIVELHNKGFRIPAKSVVRIEGLKDGLFSEREVKETSCPFGRSATRWRETLALMNGEDVVFSAH